MKKRCRSCNILKPATKQYFYVEGDGLNSRCKDCRNRAVKKWREKNRKIILEKAAKYRRQNREILKLRRRKWAENNKERIDEHNAKYRNKNREKIRERIRKWRAKNPDRVRKYYIDHIDDRRLKSRIRYMDPHCKQKHKERGMRSRWILKRLKLMARDDGMWNLLEREYENGR